MKVIYRTNDGVHKEPIEWDFTGFHFQNGAAADREVLRFYAQHCDGYVELSNEEIKPVFVPENMRIKYVGK